MLLVGILSRTENLAILQHFLSSYKVSYANTINSWYECERDVFGRREKRKERPDKMR